MTEIQSLRRANLKTKVKEAGGPAAVARRTGHADQSYIGNVLAGRKALGEKAARDIERRMGWAEYELDRRPGESIPFENTDRATLAACVREVGDALEQQGKPANPAKFAELVALYYEHCVLSGRPDPSHLNRLLKLI